MQVLLLDDNMELCNFLVTNLHEHNIDAKGANTSTEALAMLEAEQFDVLIVDLQLDEEDGFDFIEKVRKVGSSTSIPVMLLSQYDTTLARRVAAGYACNAFLRKPFTVTQLIDKVIGLSINDTIEQ